MQPLSFSLQFHQKDTLLHDVSLYKKKNTQHHLISSNSTLFVDIAIP